MRDRKVTILAVAAGVLVLLVTVGMMLLLMRQVPSPRMHVAVTNFEPAPITQVKVIAGGTTLDLGTIAPGATAGGWIVPVADSAATVQYVDDSGITRTATADTYITRGIGGDLTLDLRDGKLTVGKHPGV